jgi:hypothetical protein
MYNYTNYTRKYTIIQGNTVVIHTLYYHYTRKCIIIQGNTVVVHTL